MGGLWWAVPTLQELYCTVRASEEIALDILVRRNSQDGFCAQALVDVQRHRIYGEGFRFLFARPFKPRFAVFQGVGEDFDFVVGESVPCLFEEFGDSVGIAGVVESQAGWQVRVVGVFLLWGFAEFALGSNAGGRVVASGGVVVAVVLDFGGLGGAVVSCHG